MAEQIAAWCNAAYAVVALAVYLGVLAWCYRLEIRAYLSDVSQRRRERRDELAALRRMWAT